MKPPHAIAAIAGLAAALLLGPAPLAADEDDTPLTSTECGREYRSCKADCREKHPDDTAKRSACLPVCAARHAACDARAAFERAKPWLEDKARKTEEFLEDLLQDPPAEKDDDKKLPPGDLPDTTET